MGDFTGDGTDDIAVADNLSASVQILVAGPAVTESLLESTSALSVTAGQPLTLLAFVFTTGYAAPQGTVTFLDGQMTPGTASLVSGRWSLTTALTGASGAHTVTAKYNGQVFDRLKRF